MVACRHPYYYTTVSFGSAANMRLIETLTLAQGLCLLGNRYEAAAQGQDCSCSNNGGCIFSGKYTAMGNSHRENIALGKVAVMSSVFNSSLGREVAGPACVAVNGNTNTTLILASQSSQPNCIQSGKEDFTPWWRVDLGMNYTITDVIVYTGVEFSKRMQGVQVTVDDQVCYTYQDGQKLQDPDDASCTRPLTGRFVQLTSLENNYLTFCEIQIWVCAAGYYGPDCNMTCGQCMGGNATCDRFTGNCLSGCQTGWHSIKCDIPCVPGYFGQNCNQHCGQCKEGNTTCDRVTGYCPSGCQNGWQKPTCDTECDFGFFGPFCNYSCGKCRNGTTCNPGNGTCSFGCEQLFTGAACNETTTTQNTKGGISDVDISIIVGVISGIVGATAITIIVIILIRRRRLAHPNSEAEVKMSEKSEVSKPHTSPVSLVMQSVNNPSPKYVMFE